MGFRGAPKIGGYSPVEIVHSDSVVGSCGLELSTVWALECHWIWAGVQGGR